METYELAWAEALAQEHGHQRELLATLRSDLGEFSQHCAAALESLEADGDEREVDGASFYTGFARGGVGPEELVHQAGELLGADPDRSDRELLNAVVDAAGVRSVIEEEVGVAVVAALGALAPLARWVPVFARVGGDSVRAAAAAREDLGGVLQATAAGLAEPAKGDATPTASLRRAVEHVEEAARAISAGRLEDAIAEATAALEADLDSLRAVCETAEHVPHVWRVARRAEHAALAEAAAETVATLERLRFVLALILPQVELVARALASLERARGPAGRLGASGVAGLEAARMSLLLAAAQVWEASLPRSRHPLNRARPIPRLWFVGAALILAAAAAAIALTLSRDPAGKKEAGNTILNVVPSAEVPAAPRLSPLRASSDPAQKATFYSVAVAAARQGRLRYDWHLTPPTDDATCNRFGSIFGSPNRAVWHHAAADGCTHPGPQHLGTVTVKITTRYWECTESLLGSATASGEAPKACKRI